MSKRIALTLMGLLLASAGCNSQGARELTDLGQRLIDRITGSTAVNDALRMEDHDFPNERRIGINRLVNRWYGREAPYTTRYAQIATTDDSPLVRAAAIRALNRSRDTSAKEIYIKALSDRDARVRLEAAKALVNMPDPAATSRLITLMRDPRENLDVRIAAAEALQHYQTLEVARSLAAMLQDRQFSVAWQARQSLIALTGTDYRYNEPAWLRHLTSERPFAA